MDSTRNKLTRFRNVFELLQACFTTHALQQIIITVPASSIRTPWFPIRRWRSKMKTLIAALALLSLAAGPVFAQAIIRVPHPGLSSTYGGDAWTNQYTSREGLVTGAP
jgi:hypothetical protein